MAAAMKPGIARESDRLIVRWAGGEVSMLPYLWLRDNCSCTNCRVEQTAEKRFLISSVPVTIQPSGAAFDGEALALTWPDGHVSRYSAGDIFRLSLPRVPGWQPWPAGFEPCRAGFGELLADDALALATLERFLVDGVIVLTGAGGKPQTLERLAPRLGPIREVLFARIHDVRLDTSGYNVAHTSLELPPHNDFASYRWPPSVQALHMLVNEATGGDSVIVDGFDIVGRLREDRPEDFDVLAAFPVPFREFDDNNETYAVEPVLRCGADGQLTGVRFSNQLMQPPDPAQPGLVRFYAAYHELCRRMTDEKVKHCFRLHAGEILIVAAHRVLHARREFGASGPRHLQDAYYELDNVANHYVLLKERLS